MINNHDGCSGEQQVPDNLTGRQLRDLDSGELAEIGETGLRDHLRETAIRAHCAHAPIEGSRLNDLLADRDLVRYPVRIAFEMGTMAEHQFAQPEPEGQGVVLYVHPKLASSPRDISLAVAFFLPLINYGQLINDDHCLLYGATLHGLTLEQYFSELCRIADSIDIPECPRPEGVLRSSAVLG